MGMIENVKKVTLEAGADLSAKQFLFVSVASDGQIDPTGDGAQMHGILLDDPSAAGRAAEVALCAGGGKCKIVAGGALATLGVEIQSTAAGKAAAAASGDWVGGILLETAGADGNIVTILLLSPYLKA